MILPLRPLSLTGKLILIDLDASGRIGVDYSGEKYSSAHLPPEMIYVDKLGQPHVKTFGVDAATGAPILTGLPYDLVPVSPAHDSWSLGVTMFHLCAAEPLFLANSQDNMDRQQLLQLARLDEAWLEEKLAKISDRETRNFVSLLLSFDPKQRLSMEQALDHSFISGKKASRSDVCETKTDAQSPLSPCLVFSDCYLCIVFVGCGKKRLPSMPSSVTGFGANHDSIFYRSFIFFDQFLNSFRMMMMIMMMTLLLRECVFQSCQRSRQCAVLVRAAHREGPQCLARRQVLASGRAMVALRLDLFSLSLSISRLMLLHACMRF